MTNLFNPPQVFSLPLSLGGDLVVDFQNNPSGDGSTFVAWADGVTVTLVIDAATPVMAAATITGAHAVIHVPYALVDVVKAKTLWRLLVVTPGSPSTETVAVNGLVVRADGSS